MTASPATPGQKPRWQPLRRDVVVSVADELLHNYPKGRVIIVVDGPTAAGKTTFADDLAVALRATKHAVFRASIDDFLRPRAERWRQGRESAAGRYDDSYDYSVLRRVLVEPFKLGGSTGFVTAAFDSERDVPIEPKWLTGPPDAILVIDGSYLLRPELRGLWNASVWLDAGDSVRGGRMADRGILNGTPRADRYEDAFALYEKTRPRAAATITVDNTDADHPRRVFSDSC